MNRSLAAIPALLAALAAGCNLSGNNQSESSKPTEADFPAKTERPSYTCTIKKDLSVVGTPKERKLTEARGLDADYYVCKLQGGKP